MKRSFTVTVDEDVVEQFKQVCKRQGVQQSMLIDAFMRAYVQGNIVVHLELNNKNTISVKE